MCLGLTVVHDPGRPHLRILSLALRLTSVIAWCLMSMSCWGPQRNATPRPERPVLSNPRVTVVVAIDGVRWQEIFGGVDKGRARELGLRAETARQLLPNLYRLIDQRGCALGAPGSGTQVTASGPNFLSLPGYTEMFTGAAPVDCVDNECRRVRVPTVADDAALLQESPAEVAVITSWRKIELAASLEPQRLTISAGRAKGQNQSVLEQSADVWRAYQKGAAAKPAPGWGDFRPDRHTAEVAIGYLRHFQPRFLFVGLGETDEYAHHNDYRNYLAALRHADQAVGQIYESLERAERAGATTLLFVTSDHGRSDFVHHGGQFPASARTWLIAAGSAVIARGFVRSPSDRRLADLAPTIRALWGLEAEARLDGDRRPGTVLTELFQ